MDAEYREIGTFETKKNLSRLLVEVRRGATFTITNRGTPVAQLVPFREGRRIPPDLLVERFREIRSGVTTSDNVKSYIRGRKY